MALIDILIMGLVLAFVVSRFFKHDLPSDTRPRDKRGFDWQEFTQRLVQGPLEGDNAPTPGKVRKPKVVDVQGLSGVELLKTVDEGFDEATFKEGVVGAYKHFYTSWNSMDIPGLDKLCGPELMAQLEASLADYTHRAAKPEVVVNKVESVEIVSVSVKAKTAVVEVRVQALQSEGEIKVGKTVANQALPQLVTTVWVLARALTSDDPNWELQSMRHEGATA